MTDSRCQHLLEASSAEVRALLACAPDLEGVVRQLVEAGRLEHPALALDELDFLSHVGARLPAQGPLEALKSLRAADAYLACACVRGVRGAIDLFERAVLAPLRRSFERLAGSNADELRQSLRERLFVGDSPAIRQYSGRGSLKEWVRAAAARLAIDLHRRGAAAAGECSDGSIFDRLPLQGADLEMGVIKSQHGEKFGAAFAHALAQLTARERTLLRMHLLDGLSFEEIGSFYRVNRSTACRWVAAARQAVLKGTQRYLADQLGLSRSEAVSVLRGVRSQVDLRISGYLASPTPQK